LNGFTDPDERNGGQKEALSIKRQCELLDVPRSTFYHIAKPVTEEELALMALIDRCHLKYPFMRVGAFGTGWKTKGIARAAPDVHHGLVAIIPKHNLSLANQAHKAYPYLLRHLSIDHPNQVWATDITYIPMARGLVYLVAIMNWYSQHVLPWCLSNM